MARTRTSSVILTPVERKAQIANLKSAIREANAQIKAFTKDQNTFAKAHAAALKCLEAKIKAEQKSYGANDKATIQQIAVREKDKAVLEAQLSALVNDPSFTPVKKVKDAVVTSKGEQVVVVVSDTPVVKAKRTRRTKAEMEAFRASAAAA